MAISSVKGVTMFKYSLLILFQILLITLFGIFVRYDNQKTYDTSIIPGFLDIHVMIFIGFGFLMTFLKRYGYSALGFNWLIGALVIQWSILCQNFFYLKDGKIVLTFLTLVEADIMAATVLISFGAILGRTTGPQLITMAIIETAVACTNLYILNDVLKVADIGGSIGIHAFGAYFGLAVSTILRTKKTSVSDENAQRENELNGPSYSSDITAMIGSIFLWIFWPSFNSALESDASARYRAIVNTYLSLAAATITSFMVSAMVNRERKFDMVHIQNSTLAGGVAVGSVCNMFVHPFGALLIGVCSGTLSVCGYTYLTPCLDSKLGVKDTCGVHNLHGMPAVLSGIMSAIFAALATSELYGTSLYTVFPAMSPSENGRSAQTQGLFQLLALMVTLGMALVSGIITGLILKAKIFERLKLKNHYDDFNHWELPDQHKKQDRQELADRPVNAQK